MGVSQLTLEVRSPQHSVTSIFDIFEISDIEIAQKAECGGASSGERTGVISKTPEQNLYIYEEHSSGTAGTSIDAQLDFSNPITCVIYPQSNTEIISQASVGELLPRSSTGRLVEEDLNGFSDKELRIARNEIFARHEYSFESHDLRKHFSQFSWYNPHTKSVVLSDVEEYNVNFIKSHEDRQKIAKSSDGVELNIAQSNSPERNKTSEHTEKTDKESEYTYDEAFSENCFDYSQI